MSTIESIEKEIMPLQRDVNFSIGDTVSVHYKIIEGERERIQKFNNSCLSLK